MIVAHLIGGNQIKGITDGTVIINDKQLEASYQELVRVCGNISLGDLNTNTDTRRRGTDVQNDYIKLVRNYDEDINATNFVIDNHLTAQICYSEYIIDMKTNTLTLKIETYE